jgi:hypothetical protein
MKKESSFDLVAVNQLITTDLSLNFLLLFAGSGKAFSRFRTTLQVTQPSAVFG